MSFRDIYNQANDVLLEFQSDWDARFQWVLDYGEYAKQCIRGESAAGCPKTPLPKKRKSLVHAKSPCLDLFSVSGKDAGNLFQDHVQVMKDRSEVHNSKKSRGKTLSNASDKCSVIRNQSFASLSVGLENNTLLDITTVQEHAAISNIDENDDASAYNDCKYLLSTNKAEKLVQSSPANSKTSFVSRQIFSPYGLVSTKKKAEAYENHIAQLSALSKTLPIDNNSKPRNSLLCKRTSDVKAGDKLIFAKAAKMSETQRRSSLTRFHLRVGFNQIVRRLSSEKRRSSARLSSHFEVPSNHPIETVEEHVFESAVDHDVMLLNLSNMQPSVVLEKLDRRLLPSCVDRHSSISQVDQKVLLEVDSAAGSSCGSHYPSKEADVLQEQSVMLNSSPVCPQVVVGRLSKETIAKHLAGALFDIVPVSSEDGSDSYISDEDELTHVASTPLVPHNNKKIWDPIHFQQSAVKKNSLAATNSKHVYPGSEPRLPPKGRVAYLASLLNNSTNTIRNSSSAIGSTFGRAVTSFVKSSRPPSFVVAQMKAERLKEELQRKREKEEMALKRREQILMEKVQLQKRKLDEKMQKVAENRLRKERDEQDKHRALEQQLQHAEEKKRAQAEKRKEEMEHKRQLRTKKEAEIEERRKQEEITKLAKIKEQENQEKIRLQEQDQLKALVHHHNSSLQKKAILNITLSKDQSVTTKDVKIVPINLNETYNCEKSSASDSNYNITPHRSEMPAEELKDPENYDIKDLNSEDETDDEESPRKKIPNWAQGNPLKNAMLKQMRHPPDLEKLFPLLPNLDLNEVFHQHKKRINARTSSAIWTSPISI